MLNDYTILDFETTGLNPSSARVIEMACMRVIDGEIMSRFECIVNPEGILIEEQAKQVNGLNDDVLTKGANPRRAFALLRNVIEDSVIVAHNAAFDLAFLHYNYFRLGGQPLTNKFLCTRTVAAFRYPKPFNLESLCSRFGIENKQAHRAMGDVQATYELLNKFQEAASCDEYVNVMGYVKYYGAPAWVPEYATVRGY